MTIKIVIVTHSPSPYQVELFDAVAALPSVSLNVVYLFRADPARSWARRMPHHVHWFSDAVTTAEICTVLEAADLLVFNYYRHPLAAVLLRRRAASAQPWVFWGERPGFHYPMLGQMARRWLLRALHASAAPIWGMGEFALAAYRHEFGPGHVYVNLPYFSDLARFAQAKRTVQDESVRVILFSGALIPRKGVDELARAFVQVAPKYPALRLRLMGSGPLAAHLQSVLAPVSEQVEYLGFRDWDDLPPVYAGADVLCVPSRYDGWGLVVPEGLAAGLPVIATKRMGAAVDLIEDGQNGWLAGAGDVPDLVLALQRAAELDAAALRGLSEAATASVAEHGLASGAKRFVAACRAAVKDWR